MMPNATSKHKTILRVNKLTAGYQERTPVIKNVSFQVGSGEMVGLIGLNGAGKSSLLKCIFGLLPQQAGDIELTGNYSFIAEIPSLYEELTVWEHLELVAMSRGMEQRVFIAKADGLLKQFHMEKLRHDFPGAFSKGTRQKLMIMCSILASPDLYLIDEPFNGLDALAIKEVLEYLEQEKQRGAAIFLCTHVLETAQRISDRLIVMDHGRIIAAGTMEQLQERAGCLKNDLFDVFLALLRIDNHE